MRVPEPKDFMHHLVTVDDGSYMIDGVSVGSFQSVEGLIDVLQEDTLSCIQMPLIDVFSGGGSAHDEPGWGDDEPQYDTAGEALARAGVAGRPLYDATDPRGGNMNPNGYLDTDPLYDEAQVDSGYLGVEPHEPLEPEPYGDPEEEYPTTYHQTASEDPLYVIYC
jgi:hypothetical protein